MARIIRPHFGRARARGPSRSFTTLAAVLAIGACAMAWEAYQRLSAPSFTGRAHAMDGDSLRLDGIEMRLEGIDAPELAQTCGRDGREVACGRESRAHLAALLRGGDVVCRKHGTDQYGRALARCFAGGVEINAAMVRDGMAIAYGAYEAQEREARAGRRGVWAGSFERPQDWRRSHPR